MLVYQRVTPIHPTVVWRKSTNNNHQHVGLSPQNFMVYHHCPYWKMVISMEIHLFLHHLPSFTCIFNGNFRNLNWRYLPYIRPMFQAYVREYPHNIWPYMVLTYLHFGILYFPYYISLSYCHLFRCHFTSKCHIYILMLHLLDSAMYSRSAMFRWHRCYIILSSI